MRGAGCAGALPPQAVNKKLAKPQQNEMMHAFFRRSIVCGNFKLRGLKFAKKSGIVTRIATKKLKNRNLIHDAKTTKAELGSV
jgi:hypothetical protein